jgi:hypothetical protein
MAPPSPIIASVTDLTRPMRLLCKHIIDGVIDSTFAQMVTQEGPLHDLVDSQGSFPQFEAVSHRRLFILRAPRADR